MPINNIAKELITRFKINRFIETGIHKGETLEIVNNWYKELSPTTIPEYHIYEVDINEDYCKKAIEFIGNDPHVSITCMSSEKYLAELVKQFTTEDRVLFYLDAHWLEYWPLRDEISEVLKLKNAIFLVDDYKVPFAMFGSWDRWHNSDTGTEYIKDLIVERTNNIYITINPNKDGRYMAICFIDQEPDLTGLALIEQPLWLDYEFIEQEIPWIQTFGHKWWTEGQLINWIKERHGMWGVEY